MIPCTNPKAQYVAHRSAIDAAMQQVLESGNYVRGENARAFEAEFAKWLGLPHAITVGSGTDALRIALVAHRIGRGDEVLVTAHCSLGTVAAVELAGATPVFVDIEADTFAMDPDAARSAVTPRTRAIIVTHPYGHPAAFDRLRSLAQSHKLLVVENCAEAAGAKHLGQRVGTLGALATFDFSPTKHLGAFGDGGLVVTDDAEIALRCRRLRALGIDGDESDLAEIPGTQSRLDELQAAVLRVKLPKLDEANEARRKLAQFYRENLSELPLRLPLSRPGMTHAFHRYVVRVANRAAVKERLRLAGIESAVHYAHPAYRHPAYRDRFGDHRFPVADRAAAEILSLPMYPELDNRSAQAVVAALRSIFRTEHEVAS